MTTTMTEAPKVLLLECQHCAEQCGLQPQAARLDLHTTGLMVLRFFCLHCYELNRVALGGADFAQAIADMGVPTTIIRVPLEVTEHPHPDLPPISNFAVEKWERLPLRALNEYAMRELRGELGGV